MSSEEAVINVCFVNDTGTEIEFVFSSGDAILAGCSATTFAILGLVFNIVTILAVINHKPVRVHVTTPFVISLAFSDLLFSSVILPLMAIRFFAKWVLNFRCNNMLSVCYLDHDEIRWVSSYYTTFWFGFCRDWVVGSQTGILCQLFPLLFYGTTAATLFNITAVTLNRYYNGSIQLLLLWENKSSIFDRL